MSVENTQRDDETTVLPVADEEETVLLPAVDTDRNSVSEKTDRAEATTTKAVEEESADHADEQERGEEESGLQADSPTVDALSSDSSSAQASANDPVQPSTADADASRNQDSAPTPSAHAGSSIPAAAASATALKEAPASGVRVAQLVWAGLVIVLGVFMIAISFLRFVSIPLLLISLIAALGIALMAAAVVTSVKKG